MMTSLTRLNDTLFPGTFDDVLFPERRKSKMTAWPAMDVIEAADKYEIQVELPGLKEEDIDITYDNHTLKISSDDSFAHQTEKDDGQIKYHLQERRQGTFTRFIRLGREIDADAVTASMSNGILNIKIPKSQKAQLKRIPVKTIKALE